MNIPRSEHPNPMFVRKNWTNLNGTWEFDFDFGCSARNKELYKKGMLPKKITLPFCPESDLSGVGYKDFMDGVCYRKVIDIDIDLTKNRVLLHFGAVDYESFVYVNGELAIHHIGGYSSFSGDITSYLKNGSNEIFVIAEDDCRSHYQPTGKQSDKYESYGCFYTRTTGIWQTVWLETVPANYIEKFKIFTDIDNCAVTITGKVNGAGVLGAVAKYKDRPVGSATVNANGFFSLYMSLSELHLWEVGKGRLYDLELTFGEDKVQSYFGMRKIEIDGYKFKLNGKPVFLRMVLDQGFYPDGIYTAPTDDAFKRDIELSFGAGFNGARLHEKIFEKRFLYHCDKMGYMVWGEHANWGMDYRDPIAAENFICEWTEAVERDINHPSIIGWCPFNETWEYEEKNLKHRIVETVFKLTKALDPTRLCVDTSGNYHCEGVDIWDVHDYNQVVETFAKDYSKIGEGKVYDQVYRASQDRLQKYNGGPVFVSEYGGIKWSDKKDNAWGYGDAPKTEEEFKERYKGLTDVLLDNPYIMGMCYTQLYDVEQECNGIYTYAREEKIDPDFFKKVNTRKAKIE